MHIHWIHQIFHEQYYGKLQDFKTIYCLWLHQTETQTHYFLVCFDKLNLNVQNPQLLMWTNLRKTILIALQLLKSCFNLLYFLISKICFHTSNLNAQLPYQNLLNLSVLKIFIQQFVKSSLCSSFSFYGYKFLKYSVNFLHYNIQDQDIIYLG